MIWNSDTKQFLISTLFLLFFDLCVCAINIVSLYCLPLNSLLLDSWAAVAQEVERLSSNCTFAGSIPESPAPPSEVSRCPRARRLTLPASNELLLLCRVHTPPSVYEWVNAREYCKALWIKHCINAIHLPFMSRNGSDIQFCWCSVRLPL